MKHLFYVAYFISWCNLLHAQEDRHSTNMQDAWLSCTASANPNSARGTGHWIMYDFKDVYALHESTLWNFNTPTRINHYRNNSLNQLQGRLEDGLKDVVIDISLDGTNWKEWGRVTLPKANASGFYTGFAGPNFNGKIARYLLITARNNHGGTCYGLGEVRVNATPATVSTSNEEKTNPTYISVSPNPGKDMIQIGLESFPSGNISYTVHDLSGQVVLSGNWFVKDNWSVEFLSVQELPSGAYILKAENRDIVTTVKFEVIH